MCYSAPSPGSQSMKLKRVILGLCTTLLIVLSGCAGSDERSVQEYLEDRYNEQFTILDSEASADGGSAFSHNFTAFAYLKAILTVCSRQPSREQVPDMGRLRMNMQTGFSVSASIKWLRKSLEMRLGSIFLHVICIRTTVWFCLTGML